MLKPEARSAVLLASQLLNDDGLPTEEGESSANVSSMWDNPYPDHLLDANPDVFMASITSEPVTCSDPSSTPILCVPTLVFPTCLTAPSDEPFAVFYHH